jgi:putative membrane protein insertion efficiency factor
MINQWLSAVCIFCIRLYQKLLSPLLPPSCRFEPSCSRYAIQAYQIHGFWGGSIRTTNRLCRCHPWHPGGYDPVDQPNEKPNSQTPS